MKKLHVAFISYPFPAFVNPTLPLVSTLIRRGYRVSYATTDAFSARFAALGAEIVACPAMQLDERFGEGEDRDGRELQRFFSPMIESVPKLVDFYSENRPDVILHSNLAVGGHIVAARLGIPNIQFYSTFALDRNNLFRQIRDARYRQEISDASRQFDRLLEQHGVASRDFFFTRGKLSIYFFPRVLQPVGEAFGSDCIFAGRCAGEQSYWENWRSPDADGRPVVLVATSTMYVRGPEYFRMCVEALKDLPVHVILSIGDKGQPEWYGALPPHIETLKGIPHAQILPHADLFVFLSGTISTSEAMYHGVPMLITSHGFKELEWQGENIDSLGIGLHLRKSDTSASAIAYFANQILSDSALHERVRSVRDIVRRDVGAEELANRVEEYMAEVGIG